MKLHKPSRHDIFASLGFLLVLVTLVYAGWWAWNAYRNPTAKVDFARYPVKGIDVSAHNGEIDFDQVADSGVDFVWIKASEGETVRDSRFRENFDKANKAGLRVGAYHYFRFDCDGVMQAMNLCQALDDRFPDMGVAIDVEEESNAVGIDNESILDNIFTMIDYLQLRGYSIVLYSNKEGFLDYFHDRFAQYPIWLCSFTDFSPADDIDWTFWQYSHTGKVPGIDGNVDLDVYDGSREDFDRFPQY